MKTFSYFFNMKTTCLVMFGFLVAAPLGAFAVDENLSLEDKIARMPAFHEPLAWVGKKPTQTESQQLFDALQQAFPNKPDQAITAMENFLIQNPSSPWSPSLEANLGFYCMVQGYSTRSLSHFQSAWNATKKYDSGAGKTIADYSLVNTAELLGYFCRVREQELLYSETRDRELINHSWRRDWANAHKYTWESEEHPELSYRCGSFALMRLAQHLGKTNYSVLPSFPAPATGFSMASLEVLGQRVGLNLISVSRRAGEELPVPCIMHLAKDHYVTILERKGERYLVRDPAIAEPRWLMRSALNDEGSGNFLVFSNQVSAIIQPIDKSKIDHIFGRSHLYGANANPPPQSPPCPDDCQTCTDCGAPPPPPPVPPPSTPPSPQQKCSSCGMPEWDVSEPYISLWLKDKPMVYTTTYGAEFALRLTYNQRESRPVKTNAFSVGPNWNCNWLSYLAVSPDQYSDYWDSTNCEYYIATNFVAGGGERRYNSGDINSLNQTRLERMVDTNDKLTGFREIYPNGSIVVYGHVVARCTNNPINVHAYMTQRIDPQAHSTFFTYADSAGIVRLSSVIDPDNHTNYLFYGNTNFPTQITRLSNYLGQVVDLRYHTNGFLTNIVDVVGISSSFQYGTVVSGYTLLTNLNTPYGNTRFIYYNPDASLCPEQSNRAIAVVQPDGGTNLFLFYGGSASDANRVPASYTNVPYYGYGYYPVAAQVTFLNNNDTFHWSPRQYAMLSTTNFVQFTASDFLAGRLRNWLLVYTGNNNDYSVSESINLERLPAPDTGVEGQITWFGYYGTSKPVRIAQILPGVTNFTSFNYNSLGHPNSKFTSYLATNGSILQRSFSYSYSDDGTDLIASTGPDGTVDARYGYNFAHQVIAFTNAVGDVTTYSYNASQQLTGIVFPTGLIRTNFYTSNRLAQTYDFVVTNGSTIYYATNSFTYLNGEIRTKTDGRGLSVTYSYDALRRLINEAYPDGTSISYVYSNLDVVRVTNRQGSVTRYGYDSMRRKIAETNELGAVTQYSYCTCGSLESLVDGLGKTTSYFYDRQGRLTNIIYPDNYIVTRHLDSLGRVTNEVDNSGSSTTNFYNVQGLLCGVWNNAGLVQSNIFDINDRAISSIDALGIPVSMTYDSLGRISTRTFNDCGSESYYYSNLGLLYYYNQLQSLTQYGYDAFGRKTSETNANNEVTRYAYTAAGDLATLTDGNTNTTTWHYDLYGRVTNKLDTTSTEILRYSYDVNSRLTNRWSAAKGITTYSYDAVGNLITVVYPTSPTLTFQYDAMNRLINMVDGTGTTVYRYNNGGFLISEDGPWSNDTMTFHWQKRLRTTALLQQPSGTMSLHYEYDNTRRLTNIASPSGSYLYDYNGADRRVKDIYFPNGYSNVMGFDAMGRVIARNFMKADTNVMRREYSYDLSGRRTQVRLDAWNYVDYEYDSMGQVTSASAKEGPGRLRNDQQMSYGYDAGGNLLARTNNLLKQAFNVNRLNQLTNVVRTGTLTVMGGTTSAATNVTVNGLPTVLQMDTIDWSTFYKDGFTLVNGANTFTALAQDAVGRRATNTVTVNLPASVGFVYDANGNLTSDGLRAFDYDDENQLIRVTVTNQWKSDFAYDGKMRRRIRNEYTWTNSAWLKTNEVHYIYDGNLVIQERNSNNVPQVTYTRGLDLSGSFEGAGGIGGLLARTATSSASSTPTARPWPITTTTPSATCSPNSAS
jgi:YD repeat-containing protein